MLGSRHCRHGTRGRYRVAAGEESVEEAASRRELGKASRRSVRHAANNARLVGRTRAPLAGKVRVGIISTV